MSDYENVTEHGGEHLTEPQCWEAMGDTGLGRIVIVADGKPEIFPINYAARGGKLFFRTAEGSKLAGLTLSPEVAFETDHADDSVAWSVVVHGTARTLTAFGEINEVDSLGLQAWEPTEKYNYVEITPREITGRRFERTPS
ncbi:pyridoxamine 5'-phosphate oxidase family protein [Rhodococcus rhodnii]|nr:pyridoxamine 5'-phosphate oxidase family protein [Rhodococcus rhodnii]TXG89212.1 pyridoxamine 5'-phosphate oxidase family protein [Rhodococcus rhodnii]